jgi:SP family arabinose:H+ symporter-like MFS transporter
MNDRKTSAMLLLGKSAMTGALGGLLFGFDTVVISGANQAITTEYGLSKWTLGITVSIALWGTVAGALFSGPLGQKIGSRAALRIMAVLYVLSAVGCALAPSWIFLLVFRFIGGLGIGGSSVLGPVYIAELAPAKWRGRLVGMFQINIVIGILLAYLSNAIIASYHLGAIEWRVDLGIAVLPAVLFLVLLLSVPHSSRWLVTQNRIDEAMVTLAAMGSPDSRAEVDSIIASINDDDGQNSSVLFSKGHKLPIFLAITIGMFNQLTGINAILYYLPTIFTSAGFGSMSANYQSAGIGLANLLATLLGILLIDKLGRKTLLLIGAVGCGICLGGSAVLFSLGGHAKLLLPMFIGFIIFFAISQGAVIWVYLSEVFPTNVRSKGQSLGSTTHWVMNGIIATLFPAVFAYSKALPFGFFAVMMVVQFAVVLAFYPETKGLSLESLQHKLRGGALTQNP